MMTRTWQLQEAKSKLSELVEQALVSGPQLITKRGEEAVIVLSYSEYRQLITSQQKLSDFFRESPLAGLDLAFERDESELQPSITAVHWSHEM